MSIYTGVDGKARKVKNLYIGVDKKARKVKRAYIGVAGKARLFFSAEKALKLYQTIISQRVPTADTYSIAGPVGEYAFYAGGMTGNSRPYTTAAVLNASLTSSVVSDLSTGRLNSPTARIGNARTAALLIPGGCALTYGTSDIYTAGLVRSTISGIMKLEPTRGRGYMTGMLFGAHTALHAICGGGMYAGRPYGASHYDYYSDSGCHSVDTSNTVGTLTNLTQARAYGANASIAGGSHVLFAGGASTLSLDSDATVYSTVDAYSTSLTKVTVSNMTSASINTVGTGTTKYAVVGGGWHGKHSNDTPVLNVYAYDQALTMRPLSNLSAGSSAAGALGDTAIFTHASAATCDLYDGSLTRSTMSLGNSGAVSVTNNVENYAILSSTKHILDGNDSSIYYYTSYVLTHQ